MSARTPLIVENEKLRHAVRQLEALVRETERSVDNLSADNRELRETIAHLARRGIVFQHHGHDYRWIGVLDDDYQEGAWGFRLEALRANGEGWFEIRWFHRDLLRAGLEALDERAP